jgi:formylglycine-generating enzyme required for sulfatase activity
MLTPSLLSNKSFLANFKKQIIRSKGISHPHVADIYGYFIHKGGLLFFAFEPVEGLTLDQLITTSAKNRINIKQIQGLLTQLTAAVNISTKKWHQVLGGIENQFVFVIKKGGVKFLPFSMREFFHDSEDSPVSVYGYKSSCSPQALPKDAIDSSSDSYAIAVGAYRLLAGDKFSIADTESERAATSLLKPQEITDEQWNCLQKALSSKSSQRYTNAAQFVKAFFPNDSQQPASAEAHEALLQDDISSQSKSKRFYLKIVKRTLILPVPKFVLPISLLLLGMAIGFILGVFSSTAKIDSANARFETLQTQSQAQAQTLELTASLLELAQAKAKHLEIQNKSLNQQISQPHTPGSAPLSVFRDPLAEGNYGPDMVVIAAGSFMMGDSSGDGNDNEKPAHRVEFKHQFALARYEVSFAQYDFFARQTARKLPDDDGWGRDLQPVINVTWRDARAYTRWLAKATGLPYRLPTEAEWEYVARAGTTTNFWWGDTSSPGFAHCTDCGDPLGGKQPLAIGSLKPNPWGIYDLNGNVDEWVIDCYREDYSAAKADGSPYQPAGCKNRTMRGGSWFDIERITRSASRYRHPPDSKRNSWGFRVALDVK